MTTIETLKEQYNTVKGELETLETELASLNNLYDEIQWIYQELKKGVVEVNLVQTTDEDGNVIQTNQAEVDKWNNRWTKIDEFNTLLELTKQDLVENIIRSFGETKSMSRILNEDFRNKIKGKQSQINEKTLVLNNTQDALKLALFEAEGIE